MVLASNSATYGLAIIGFMVTVYALFKIPFVKKSDDFIPIDSASASLPQFDLCCFFLFCKETLEAIQGDYETYSRRLKIDSAHQDGVRVHKEVEDSSKT
eukprot:UN01565